MIVGNKGYMLSLSRLAFSFRGAVSIEYLENAPVARIRELNAHLTKLSEEIK